jgi:Protein of unknown function (DUF4232)
VTTSSAHTARGLIAAAAVAFCAVTVAACGSAGSGQTTSSGSGPAASGAPATSSATGTPAQASSPSASAPTAPSAPAACATSGLQVSVPVSKGNAAAGSSYYPIDFANTSGASCTLYGYPGVSFVSGIGGSQIGIPATRNPTTPKQLITLAPSQTAHAELQVVDAENYPPADCGLVTAHWLKIYPPNQTAPLYVSFTAKACTKSKTILTVQTVQPGSG